jgi:DMSO/TMAO reductase YedYZ heme-binding membrane subunit
VVLVLTVVVIAGVIAAEHTSHGRSIVGGVHDFLLKCMGVFALIGLTTAVGVGLVATDRIVMRPASRVVAQALHRGVSLAALTALVAHILLEMAAHRVDIIDAVVPFHAHFRTLYTGLGTIAFDLTVLIIITGYLRGKFAGKLPWAWRAIHAVAYLAWPLSIIHGLLGGRTAHPYVDWSYGACVALVLLALAVRFAATVRSEEEKISHPVSDRLSAPAEGVIPGSRVSMAPVSPAMSQPIALPAGSSGRAGQASPTQIMAEVPAAAPVSEPVIASWREPADVPQAGWMASSPSPSPWAGQAADAASSPWAGQADDDGPHTVPGWPAPSYDTPPPAAAAPAAWPGGPAGHDSPGWVGSYDPSASPYDAQSLAQSPPPAAYEPPRPPGWAASPGLGMPRDSMPGATPHRDWSTPPGSPFPSADRAVPGGPLPGGGIPGIGINGAGINGAAFPANDFPANDFPSNGYPAASMPPAGPMAAPPAGPPSGPPSGPRDWPGPQAQGGAPGHRTVPRDWATSPAGSGLGGQQPPPDWSAPRQRTTPGDWATPGETTTPRGWTAPSDWSTPPEGWTTPDDSAASPGDWSAPGEWTPPGEWMPSRGGAQ